MVAVYLCKDKTETFVETLDLKNYTFLIIQLHHISYSISFSPANCVSALSADANSANKFFFCENQMPVFSSNTVLHFNPRFATSLNDLDRHQRPPPAKKNFIIVQMHYELVLYFNFECKSKCSF